MIDEQEILLSCQPEFARAWHHAGDVSVLMGDFVDAACLIGYVVDGEARVHLTQFGFKEFFGERPTDADSMNFLMMITRQDRQRFIDTCKEAIATGGIGNVEVSWRVTVDSDGNRVTSGPNLRTNVSVQKVGQRDDEELLYLAMLDVTKRRYREHDLSRNQYASSLSAMFTEAFTIDLETGKSEALFANSCQCCEEQYLKTVGFHETSKRVHPDDRKLLWANSNVKNIKRSLYGENPVDLLTFDLRRMECDGEYHWISFFITRVANFDNHMQVLVCVRNLDEVKESQRRERELRSKAQIDALTGVFNRGASEELMSNAISERTKDNHYTLVVFDVDHFKNVNDTYGHLMGDELLKVVATSLRSICRDGDIVGRVGGDEFVVLFVSDLRISDVTIGSRLKSCLDKLVQFSSERNIDPPLTLSAGVIYIDETISSYADAFAKADDLMYETKKSGRNGYRLYRP